MARGFRLCPVRSTGMERHEYGFAEQRGRAYRRPAISLREMIRNPADRVLKRAARFLFASPATLQFEFHQWDAGHHLNQACGR